MSNKSPIFPISEPRHFSDYGFDPQIDYFQVLEEARRHKRDTSSRSSWTSSSNISIDTIHFKLQKPISKDHHHHHGYYPSSSSSSSKKKIKKNSKKIRWWKNALLFFKWNKWTPTNSADNAAALDYNDRRAIRGSISGPVYIADSTSGSSTPYRTTSRPSSGPLAGTLTPTDKDEVQIPYICLREINNMNHHHHRTSTSAMPIYLVT